MAEPKKVLQTLDDVELPPTTPYRVAMLGATYYEAEAVYGPTGPTIAHVGKLAKRGEVIMLDEPQARRLLDLEAVKATDEPRSYEEMHEPELARIAKARGITVPSSSQDAAQPLRDDYINALTSYDAGVASIAPAQVGGQAVPAPVPVPEQNVPAGVPTAPTPEADGGPKPEADEFDALTGADLTAAAETAGVDVKTGGSRANGSLTADEVRAALRAKRDAPAAPVDPVVANAPEATGANVNALAAYITAQSLTPEQTVAIAGDDAERAQAVLDAENLVTASDPRAQVAEALQAIINGSSE
jgi:hypothetical protein